MPSHEGPNARWPTALTRPETPVTLRDRRAVRRTAMPRDLTSRVAASHSFARSASERLSHALPVKLGRRRVGRFGSNMVRGPGCRTNVARPASGRFALTSVVRLSKGRLTAGGALASSIREIKPDGEAPQWPGQSIPAGAA